MTEFKPVDLEEALIFADKSITEDTNVMKKLHENQFTIDQYQEFTYINMSVNYHNQDAFEKDDDRETMEARINASLPFAFEAAAETFGITKETAARNYYHIVEKTATTYGL